MDDASPIRILVAEDHALVRQGLKLVLSREPRLQWIGEAADGEAALQLARELRPDVLLLDLGLPRLDGLEVMRSLSADNVQARVLVVTARQDPASVRAALSFGAHGYLLKTDDTDALVEAIVAVAAGGYHVSTELAHVFDRQRDRQDEPLTPRELEIAARVGRGLSSKAIGRDLGISEHTVRKHRENIARKLGLHNAAELAAWSIRQRI